MKNLTYSVRARVEVEISLGQSWSPQETAENAARQAKREAEAYLTALSARENRKVRVIGPMKMLHLVTVPEE